MDRRQRLQEALQQRDLLRERVAQIRGRLEAAQAEVTAVETECRQRKVDPTELDSTIQKLQTRLDTSLQGLETRIQAARAKVAAFTEPDANNQTTGEA